MKNILFIFLAMLGTMGLTFMTGCEEDVALYDGPELVHFTATEGTFYIQDVANPSFEIMLGSTVIKSEDRTYTVEIVTEGTTATSGVEYQLESTSVTIPANAAVGAIIVKGLYQGASPAGSALKLKIASAGSSTIANFKDSYTLNLYQFCPFIIDDFVGDYTYTSEMFGDAWDVTVEKVDDHTLVAKDLVDAGKDMIIKLDDSDPANFTASVEKQGVWTHSSYGLASFEGGGSFSACDLKIVLKLELTVAAGSFGSATEVLQKK